MALYPVDTARFWRDNEASLDKPFRIDKPQIPMSLHTDEGCIWDELGIEWNVRFYEDEDYRLGLVRQYNDKAEEIIGKRTLSEERRIPNEHLLPRQRTIRDLFECELTYTLKDWMGYVEWASPTVNTPKELEALLERVAAVDIKSFVFPKGYFEAWETAQKKWGVKPRPLMHAGGVRAPVTAAMSIVGVENAIMWLYDEPKLMDRLRDLMAQKIVEIEAEVRRVSGRNDPGFRFYDDNSMLLSPDLYERFGYPVLKHVFSIFAPGENDRRFQHSDSPMGHLMPLLHKAGLNEANFGPTVNPREIRRQMPKTVIIGHIPPFTFSAGTTEEVYAAAIRDIEWVGGDGGLVMATAGSVNAGSKLEGLRAVMSAIQHHGRYQPLD